MEMGVFMYSLKSTTKRNIENCVSVAFPDLVAMDYSDEPRLLKPVNGGKFVFSTKRDPRKIGRGNPFLARKRFRTMEEIDKRLAEICNAEIKRSR
jgi:hypothetical protein